MDDYPVYSVTPSIPLLITLGLPATAPDDGDAAPWLQDAALREQAPLLRSALPALTGDAAEALSRYLTAEDVSGPLPAGAARWRGRTSGQRYRYRIRTAGRTYVLPPRRARLPDDVEVPADGPAPTLHSPFSPLSPACGLYPDGLLDGAWVRKHQEAVPSVFVCFYALPADPTMATASLHDKTLREDIAAVRSAVAQAGYRSRVAVAVFAEDEGADVAERLEAIRRGSGVDARLFFALAADAGAAELQRVAENMLATLYGPALDYYRDVARHARKKRGRGAAPQPAVPPTRGTSQTLGLAGWQLRYDVKAAVLAETRQEPDAALRLLDQAYDALVGGGSGSSGDRGLSTGGDWGLAGAIPSWSPRWNEARLLADALAVRSLRCLLQLDRPSAAVRRWSAHRARMHALLDARGRRAPAASYGWHAWEARWACVMADLLARVDGVPPLFGPGTVFLRPEKALLAERLAPWDHLHHPGYWLRAAARHTAQRRALARALPDDDRRAPGPGTAPPVYDDYMCPPPHVEFPLPDVSEENAPDHTALVVGYLRRAHRAFARRHQPRAAAELALEAGRELVAAGAWSEALALLAPLWGGSGADATDTDADTTPSYRTEGWTAATEELGWTLRAAAQAAGRADLVVAVDWALLDGRYTRRTNWPYDVAQALGGQESDEGKEAVALTLADAPSFLAASFAFARREGKAGEAVRAQLALRSHAFAHAPPVVLETLAVRFGEGVPAVVLRHGGAAEDAGGKIVWSSVALEDPTDGDDTLTAQTDLTLRPQTTRVWELTLPLRAAGDAQAHTATLGYRCAAYTLALAVPFLSPAGLAAAGYAGAPAWYGPETAAGAARRPVTRADRRAIHVLPRPPKLSMELVQPAAATAADDGAVTVDAAAPLRYYTNEPIALTFVLTNGEAAAASVQLDVALVDETAAAAATVPTAAVPSFALVVGDSEEAAAVADVADTQTKASLSATLGTVPPGQSRTLTLRLAPSAQSATLALTLRAAYRLAGDAAAAPAIAQTAACVLSLTNPFEANYDLLPRLHAAPWPSLFDGDGVEGAGSSGLAQAWTLVTRYASFAAEPLRVVGLDVVVQPVAGVTCRVRRAAVTDADADTEAEADTVILPRRMDEAAFDLTVRKARLDDRAPVALDAAFVVRWQRTTATTAPPAGPVNTTTLPVPQLTVLGTEPRVLAAVTHVRRKGRKGGGPRLLCLDVVIENASNHFLTFGLSLEPSSAFAFSGAKLTTVHVLPVARRTVSFRLVPLVQGAWLRPGLVVRDKYFQKVLRILPTEGMRLDKDGLMVWVGEEGDEEENKEDERTR